MKLRQESIRPKNRFDMEQDIMSVWAGIDDIEIFYEKFYEYHEDMTVDEAANALLGIHRMLHIKCEKLFNTFEEMIKDGKIS